jgi:hypothetical protein
MSPARYQNTTPIIFYQQIVCPNVTKSEFSSLIFKREKSSSNLSFEIEHV